MNTDQAYAQLANAGFDVTIAYDWCDNANVGVECDTDEEEFLASVFVGL